MAERATREGGWLMGGLAYIKNLRFRGSGGVDVATAKSNRSRRTDPYMVNKKAPGRRQRLIVGGGGGTRTRVRKSSAFGSTCLFRQLI